jgi:hypothetical protein
LVDLVAGTANQVIVTDDTNGGVVLSTPQDIHTGASPTFAGLSIGALNLTSPTVYTSTDTIGATGIAFKGNTAGGSFTLNLPALAGNGRLLLISADGGNTLTLDPNGSETINGDTTFPLVDDESLILVDFGTEWRAF